MTGGIINITVLMILLLLFFCIWYLYKIDSNICECKKTLNLINNNKKSILKKVSFVDQNIVN